MEEPSGWPCGSWSPARAASTAGACGPWSVLTRRRASVERVELYLGDARVATLYQPPYAQPLVLPEDAQTGYVRAVAYLADGTSAEDLVLLNVQAAAMDKMDVRFVELYANVVDGWRTARGELGAGDLQVFEDGLRQSVQRVERVDNTPLRLVTLIDNSASMQPRTGGRREQAASSSCAAP